MDSATSVQCMNACINWRVGGLMMFAIQAGLCQKRVGNKKFLT